jgi:hypothetical protein
MPKSAVAEALAQGKLPPVNLVKAKIQGAKRLHKIVALEIARWAPDGLSKGARVTCRF